MKRHPAKHADLPAGICAAPEPPLPGQFLDTANNRAILKYFIGIRHQYLYANNFGLALDDNDLGPDRTPVLLDNLFVPPFLSDAYLSPAILADSEQKNTLPPLVEVYLRLRDRQRLFILGDPGAGKTTLIAWLMLALSYSGENHVKGALGNLVPFAFILRDLPLRGVDSWNALMQVRLQFGEGPVWEDAEALGRLLGSGQMLFLVDGVDEISEPSLRAGLGKALLEGMNRFPRCRFVFTSRLVGFSLTEFFNLPAPVESPLRRLAGLGGIPLLEDVESLAAAAATPEPCGLSLCYLAPFTLGQVRRFVTNWYGQYEPNVSLHPARVRDLMARLEQNDGLGHLCRIPVLLNMICFIHARRLRLPDGRAELYGRIAETYLVTLDRARGLRFQGRELGVDYHDLGHWLARLALRMQERRGEADDTVLAGRGEVEAVLREGLEEKGLSGEEARAQGRFILDYIAQRSGFLIPRGREGEEEVYGFNHLSFQEYFAARALEEELLFMKEGRWRVLRANLCKPQWREPFVLLFELLPTPKKADFLADKLFGKEAKQLGKKAGLHPGWVVLAHVAMDTAVRLGSDARNRLLEKAWQTLLDMPMKDEAEFHYSHKIEGYDEVFAALWKDQFGSLEKFGKAARGKGMLRLTGKGVDDISVLSRLPGISKLGLNKTQVSDLSPLSGLVQLQELLLDGTQVSDLSPLSGLVQLQELFLSGPQVSDLSPLTSLQQLQWLYLINPQVCDLSPLARLQQLQKLFLSGHQVSDLSPLLSLVQLKELYLFDTQVSDLRPLSSLEQLQMLDLSNTQVSDLSPLAALPQLKKLYLNNTQVRDISCLGGRVEVVGFEADPSTSATP